MVDFVNALVKRAPVECAVRPVMPRVFQDEENSNLKGHFEQGRKRCLSLKAEEKSHGVEEPDLREFDGEVAYENKLRTVPLLSRSWDFLLY